MPLNKISRGDVESWFDKLIEEDCQNTTINGYYKTLKTMLTEVVARKIIDKDPTEKMGRLVNDRKEIKIITAGEFRKLFVGDWKRDYGPERNIRKAVEGQFRKTELSDTKIETLSPRNTGDGGIGVANSAGGRRRRTMTTTRTS
jgi:hypothetical protein